MKPKNQMTPEECKMAFPKASWFKPQKSPTMRVEASEAQLQVYANDAIILRGWSYLRFPDGFLRWMKLNTPEWIQAVFFGQIGGKMPDNLIMIPLGNGQFFAVKMELKTQDKKGREVGKLHGKQKRYAEVEEWYIVRLPEQINAVLDEVEKKVQKIKEIC
jgi:hypothetical protein